MPRLQSSILFGDVWYDGFTKKANNFFSWDGIAKQGKITEVWTKTMKSFHENKGFIVRCRGANKGELSGIDVTIFDKNHSEAQIAIELQHWWPNILIKDLPKLACSNAQLKILMTRLREDEDLDRLKKDVIDFWQKRSNRVKNDDLLMLLAITKSNIGEGNYTYIRVEGYLSKQSKDWIIMKPRIL